MPSCFITFGPGILHVECEFLFHECEVLTVKLFGLESLMRLTFQSEDAVICGEVQFLLLNSIAYLIIV